MNEECRDGQEAVTSRGHRLVASSKQLFTSLFHLCQQQARSFPRCGCRHQSVLFCACGGLALAGGAARGWGERRESVGTV